MGRWTALLKHPVRRHKAAVAAVVELHVLINQAETKPCTLTLLDPQRHPQATRLFLFLSPPLPNPTAHRHGTRAAPHGQPPHAILFFYITPLIFPLFLPAFYLSLAYLSLSVTPSADVGSLSVSLRFGPSSHCAE